MSHQSPPSQNRFFRLPFVFDPVRLADDLATCRTVTWPKHFNQADYSGHWSSIALRSVSGSETDIRAHPTDRGHLVLDCRRNAWSDALFRQAGYDFDMEQQNRQPSQQLKQQIMAELARHNTETARQLIDQLATERGA